MRKRKPSSAGEALSRTSLIRTWRSTGEALQRRLDDFRRIWETADDEALFCELAFCLFTPQSKATSCWAAVSDLRDCGLLLRGAKEAIARRLNRVRFKNNKAGYLVEARRLFLSKGGIALKETLAGFPDGAAARDWLVRTVKGLGLKEASHFLRNIGRGEDLAILDRHILKNLKALGVIDQVPSSLGRKTYLEIERRLLAFSREAGIPPAQLDLLLWCRETGEIFK